MTEAPVASNVDDHLPSLLRKDLIRPEGRPCPARMLTGSGTP